MIEKWFVRESSDGRNRETIITCAHRGEPR